MVKDGTSNGEEENGDDKITMVYTTTHYIGLELHEGNVNFVLFELTNAWYGVCTIHLLTNLGAKSLDLSWQVDDFKNTCTSWDLYDSNVSALHVAHTKK